MIPADFPTFPPKTTGGRGLGSRSLRWAFCVCVCVCLHAHVQFQLFNQSVDVAKLLMNIVLLEDTLNTALLNRLRPAITIVTGE
jgi:hypothetical protein